MKRREILRGLSIIPLAGAAACYPIAAHKKNALSGTADPSEDWLPKKQLIRSANASCLRSGHLLFVGGIDGWYARNRPEPGDIQVQIRSALSTIKELLEAGGSSMANVLQVRMALAEPNKNLAKLNEAYREFFPENPPVRSYSGSKISQMGRDGVLVQVSCIAYVD